jgi:hypothetical protein
VAVEDRRKLSSAIVQQISILRPLAKGTELANQSPAEADYRARCWKCGEKGHLHWNCFPTTSRRCDSAKLGNAPGARQ